jgi:hypothetical protein
MAFVPVPKDLSKVKTKVVFGMTKRQIICFGAGALIGIPLFFLLRDAAGTNLAAFVMVLVMLPAFLMAMYEKHGQYLEVILRNMATVLFIRPKQRPYETRNLYIQIEKRHQLEKEIMRIVKEKDKRSGA